MTTTLNAVQDTKGWRVLDADGVRYYIDAEGKRYTQFVPKKKEKAEPDVEIVFLEPWRAPLALKRVAE